MSSLLRRGYRTTRKRLRRVAGRALLARYRARNRFSTRPVIGTAPVVLSLTTYGERLATVAYTIESIGSGGVRPSRLILWLDKPESLERLPANLRRLQARGLTVQLSENFGPHTKYYPSLPLSRQAGLPLVTADDDILYPRWWLKRLVDGHAAFPEAVSCHWASVVAVSDGGAIQPYATWPRCRDTTASVAHFATGVSGVIYPVRMLDALARRGLAFRAVSPRADDIWLHWVALQEQIPVRQVEPTPRHFLLVPGTQETTLLSENVESGGNDERIRDLYSAEDIARLRSARS